MAELMKRKDQREEDTWRLEDLFETDEQWSQRFLCLLDLPAGWEIPRES